WSCSRSCSPPSPNSSSSTARASRTAWLVTWRPSAVSRSRSKRASPGSGSRVTRPRSSRIRRTLEAIIRSAPAWSATCCCVGGAGRVRSSQPAEPSRLNWVGVSPSGRSARSSRCRHSSAAWCSQKPGLISGPRGSGTGLLPAPGLGLQGREGQSHVGPYALLPDQPEDRSEGPADFEDLRHPDPPIAERLVAADAAQAAERDPGACRPHPLRLDRGDREGARGRAPGLVPALRAGCEGAVEPGLLLVRVPARPGGHVGGGLPDGRDVALDDHLLAERVHRCLFLRYLLSRLH